MTQHIKRAGYWYIKDFSHPFGGKQGYVAEHRIVMEKHLGRFLTKKEVVHHINGIITDNRIENLKLFSSHGQHTKEAHPEVYEKNRERRKGVRPANYNRGEIKCGFCGKSFVGTLGVSRKKYCSRECYWKGKKGQPSKFPEGLIKGHGWNKGMHNTWAVKGKAHPMYKHGKYSKYPVE